jgi:hypothetical protein
MRAVMLLISCSMLLSVSYASPGNTSDVSPSEVHLALTNSPDEMSIAWATLGKPQSPALCTIRDIGSPNGELAFHGKTSPMNTSSTRVVYLHYCVVSGLREGSRYAYAVSNGGTWFSSEFSTRRSEVPDGHRIAFFGDTGNSEHWSNGTVPSVRSEVINGTIDAVVHTGDMAYYTKNENGTQGDKHAQELSDLTNASIPLMVTPGNAEVFCYRPAGISAWGACMLDYQSRFIMPGYNATHSLWSSFDLGRAHFLLLDSEAHMWCGATQNHSAQQDFMERDLAQANTAEARRLRPFIVAVVHRPLYSSCNSTKEQQSMREGFAAILSKHKVEYTIHDIPRCS